MNSGNLENIRIKFGYGNPIVNSETQDIYTSWEKFKDRDEELSTRESPWIKGIITNVTRKIQDDGAVYTIEATSPLDLMLNKVSKPDINKDYKSISEYTPTGNMVYNKELFKKIESKFV